MGPAVTACDEYGLTIVEVVGDLYGNEPATLGDNLSRLIATGSLSIIVDLLQAESFGPTAVDVLAGAATKVTPYGGFIRLVGDEKVRQEVAHHTPATTITVYSDLQTAKAAATH